MYVLPGETGATVTKHSTIAFFMFRLEVTRSVIQTGELRPVQRIPTRTHTLIYYTCPITFNWWEGAQPVYSLSHGGSTITAPRLNSSVTCVWHPPGGVASFRSKGHPLRRRRRIVSAARGNTFVSKVYTWCLVYLVNARVLCSRRKSSRWARFRLQLWAFGNLYLQRNRVWLNGRSHPPSSIICM